jgi:hypothetical protein
MKNWIRKPLLNIGVLQVPGCPMAMGKTISCRELCVVGRRYQAAQQYGVADRRQIAAATVSVAAGLFAQTKLLGNANIARDRITQTQTFTMYVGKLAVEMATLLKLGVNLTIFGFAA